MRLFRPYTPLHIKVQVAEMQLRAAEGISLSSDALIYIDRSGIIRWSCTLPLKLSHRLFLLLDVLAITLNCRRADLRLDHHPALALRQQFKDANGKVVRYVPDANDSGFLHYLPHGAEHEGSHHVKTFVRGSRGQFSDVALIKRERRRQRCENPTPAQKKIAKAKQERRERAKKLRRKIKQERKRK